MSKAMTHTYKLDQIDAAIVSVEKDTKSLQQKIHNVAASIAFHWSNGSAAKKITDDKALEAAKLACSQLNALLGVSAYHADALAKWIGMFLPLNWSEENENFYVNSTDEFRLMGKAFVEARDNQFWTVKPPSKPKPYMMWDALQSIVDRATKRQNSPVEGDDIDMETVRKLRTLISEHEATAS